MSDVPNNFEDINLTFSERLSLLSFRFKKRQKKEKVKGFYQLYYEYDFLTSNSADSRDLFNASIPDGTCSISDRYIRFKIWRRRKRLESLPNWIAVIISLISLLFSGISLLWQLGYISIQ